MCEQNPHFEKRGPERFLVKHYAGDVQYNVSGMTDKNKDQLVRELLDLVSSSPNSFVRTLFPEGPSGESESKKRPPTAGDRIRNSAGELVAKLMQAQPSYIRCIKPNESKSPQDFDASRVLHQVKYLGLCENVRYTWKGDARSASEVIFKDLGIAGEEWQMGVTKAFIRHPETVRLFALESLRDRYWHNMAIRIQRAWRNFLSYRNECAIRIQRCYRSNRDQMKYVQIRDHGHAVLGGRKERRRFSLVSMRRFMGDYLDIGRASPGSESQLIKTAISYTKQNKKSETIKFVRSDSAADAYKKHTVTV
ncbi:MAG: P-loop containing nucleoside triphosphate hydrolase protein, partial [Olpidium bornovanus]